MNQLKEQLSCLNLFYVFDLAILLLRPETLHQIQIMIMFVFAIRKQTKPALNNLLVLITFLVIRGYLLKRTQQYDSYSCKIVSKSMLSHTSNFFKSKFVSCSKDRAVSAYLDTITTMNILTVNKQISYELMSKRLPFFDEPMQN